MYLFNLTGQHLLEITINRPIKRLFKHYNAIKVLRTIMRRADAPMYYVTMNDATEIMCSFIL